MLETWGDTTPDQNCQVAPVNGFGLATCRFIDFVSPVMLLMTYESDERPD